MIIDEDILKDGIDEVLLAKLIDKHSLEQERYEKLTIIISANTQFVNADVQATISQTTKLCAITRSISWILQKAIL